MCPLVMTPAVCPLTSEIFGAVPYLSAEPEAVERWRPTVAERRVVHIGVHWQAEASHIQGRERSLPLQTLAPLFEMPGIHWYSLQRGASQEIAAYPQLTDLSHIDDPAARFVETAAVMTHLDLFIACDSTPLHVAGALGCPVWCLLPYVFDARWTLRDGTTPWYPGHRLFAQTEPGHWASVVDEVRYALEQALDAGTLTRRAMRTGAHFG
jgi:hypothetical protein